MSRVHIPAAKRATYTTYSDWLEKVEAVLKAEDDVKPTRVHPAAVWTKMYVRNMTPEEAAQRVAGARTLRRR